MRGVAGVLRAFNLGVLPGFTYSFAASINDAGQIVGTSDFFPPPPITTPEPSTWAMMLVASLA
jgi:hypothetical protein